MALACFVIGILIGMCTMGAAWSNYEKKSIRRGFMSINDDVYRLTRVYMRDLEEK